MLSMLIPSGDIVVVNVPNMGDSVSEGELGKWHKSTNLLLLLFFSLVYYCFDLAMSLL